MEGGQEQEGGGMMKANARAAVLSHFGVGYQLT